MLLASDVGLEHGCVYRSQKWLQKFGFRMVAVMLHFIVILFMVRMWQRLLSFCGIHRNTFNMLSQDAASVLLSLPAEEPRNQQATWAWLCGS